jgi:uncharacterized membrane protein
MYAWQMNTTKSYFAFLITFLVVDFIWIGAFAGEFYNQQLVGLLKTSPNYSLVGLFYLCYAAGVIYLVVQNAKSYQSSAFAGAVFGALAYGTFTITNYTLIEGWTLALVVTDVLWGAFITGVSSLVAYHFHKPKALYSS